jgi:hypothetical protein
MASHFLSGGCTPMMEKRVTVPDLILMAGTRVALGVGIGLVLSERLNRDQRKAAGWALLAVGAATTVPLLINIIGQNSGVSRVGIREVA